MHKSKIKYEVNTLLFYLTLLGCFYAVANKKVDSCNVKAWGFFDEMVWLFDIRMTQRVSFIVRLC